VRLRGLAHLRRAEVENCVARHNADCCIFPLAGGGLHQDRDPAELGRQAYTEFLRHHPQDLGARWILNLLCMALGSYPDGVPEAHRIPPEAFTAEAEVGRFRDIAPALGVDALNLCGGVAIGDFDSDDLLDIITSTYDPRGPLHFYRNLGNGRFEDRSDSSGLSEQLGGLNCVAADYNSDGHLDLLVLRGAWLGDEGRIRNSLLRNNGDGTFSDVTEAAGMAQPAYPTQAAVFGDFNLDGHLDCYVVNESRLAFGEAAASYPAQLFLNTGEGTFVEQAETAGVRNDRYAKGVCAGDYDNDGDLDLYVSNIGRNRLYRNEGDGTFQDVAANLQVEEPSGRSFATWFFDYDNDGWLDLFVTAYDAKLESIAAHYLGQPASFSAPRLYRNQGDGTFQDVAAAMNLARPYLPMGANFGDLDSDGFLDIYLATGDPEFESLMPNIMLRNDAGKRFQDVTYSGGFGHLQKGHGVAFADLDNDGDQDLYHQLGGFFPADKFHNALFLNPGHDHAQVVIELVGEPSNRSAIGARLQLVLEQADGSRCSLYRAIGCVSSFGGSPLRQEIGVGNAKRIVEVIATWPGEQNSQTSSEIQIGGLYRWQQGKEPQAVVRRTFRFLE
jgi:hypothetical protein